MKKRIAYKEPRNNRVTITLSDRELEAIDDYCKRYKSESRTSVIREGAIRFVMGRFIEDYPTLFQKSALDRLIVTDEEETTNTQEQ
ncbi:MAG: ribbon-helix-helix domain-containing protein [Bacteroidales bacterium]|nr:ribbon-helix-helix domain-containing protein [Bacteroidales bacterium]